MGSHYVFTKEKQYLLMVITGEYEKNDFLSFPGKIREQCIMDNKYRVLINALALKVSSTPILDRFFLGEEIAYTVGSKIKIAVAWPGEDINKLCENVAVNRGGRIGVFASIAEGEKWLLEDTN